MDLDFGLEDISLLELGLSGLVEVVERDVNGAIKHL